MKIISYEYSEENFEMLREIADDNAGVALFTSNPFRPYVSDADVTVHEYDFKTFVTIYDENEAVIVMEFMFLLADGLILSSK